MLQALPAGYGSFALSDFGDEHSHPCKTWQRARPGKGYEPKHILCNVSMSNLTKYFYACHVCLIGACPRVPYSWR
ncbi:hypothetical protein M407DRAFT_241155 [Tulasnella calospora MUT 4182]|uniref:Uncharacterized protein n=1 Tax=Tulasnella calospora MUT 4182 TaxID=1051891 RepID=A0A0C3QWA1_9AGAM|nr:hypothetical protein M407DRAFT_241155 [Tulasnella calospora MUT 4182]